MHVTRIVDSWSHGDQLARGAQLVDDRRGNAEACGEGVDAGRLCAGAAQPDQEPLDTLTHLRLEQRLMPRQPHAVAPPNELTGRDELIHDRTQRIVSQEQATSASMAARPGIIGLGAHPGDQGIDARIGRQWLAAVNTSQHRQKATLGEPRLYGLDRPLEWLVGHSAGLGRLCALDREPDRLELLVGEGVR